MEDEVQSFLKLLDFVAENQAYKDIAKVAVNHDIYDFPKCLNSYEICNHSDCPLWKDGTLFPCQFEVYVEEYGLK